MRCLLGLLPVLLVGLSGCELLAETCDCDTTVDTDIDVDTDTDTDVDTDTADPQFPAGVGIDTDRRAIELDESTFREVDDVDCQSA